MELALPLLAGGFLLGLIVGRWWVLLVPIVFGLFGWSVWSEDREVDAEAVGLFLGGIPAAGAVLGVLIRLWSSAEPGQWRRWLRLFIGLEPKAPEQRTPLARKNGQDLDDQRP